MNRGLFFCFNHACPCKTIHPFSDFTKKKLKERKSKDSFLNVEIHFWTLCFIANSKYGF